MLPVQEVKEKAMNDEWYTPNSLIELARCVMGGINLDPASCDVAQEIVKADCYLDESQNGLLGEWNGKVWLNPPYSKGLIEQFVTKLLFEIYRGSTTEAICLVNNATETRWFQSLLERCSAVCFVRGRIKFFKAVQDVILTRLVPGDKPRQGQAVFYFGMRSYVFERLFGKIGWATCK